MSSPPAAADPVGERIPDRRRARIGGHSTTDILLAAAVAGSLSGAPSTLHALFRGRPPLAAVRAAGELVGHPGVVPGLLAHVAVSLWWTAVLALLLPRRHPALWGAAGGLAIAALDLSIARRRYRAVAALPTTGQLADHVAFGVLAATILRCRDREVPTPGSGRMRQKRQRYPGWWWSGCDRSAHGYEGASA